MTSMSSLANNYRRQLPTAAEAGLRPPLPELVKVAFTQKGRRRKSTASLYDKERRASKMEWTLKQLADSEWHEFPGIDTPHSELIDRGFIESQSVDRKTLYRITKAGLRLHYKAEKLPMPKSKPKAQGRRMRRVQSQAEGQARQEWQQAFSLLMCLG